MAAPDIPAPALGYDVVMATRNRPEAVELSLPLLLAQTRLPERIVIVDSSDDPAPIRALAEAHDGKSGVPVLYIASAAGLTLQRNRGLGECRSDIVLFPDDDSLLYPDAAAEIMAVYEADTEGRIAGVAAASVDRAPPETRGNLGAYEAEKTGGLRSALRGGRQRVKEALGFANPFVATGLKLAARHPRPDWLAAREVEVVPYMTGFRMSFRRAIIAATGFDETLQRYGWFEDIDASWSALRQGLLVTAGRARIYHHRVATARDNGHRMGLWAVLNRGYVVMKHVAANPEVFPDRTPEIRRLNGYCRARAMAYRVLARDAFGRERAAGARDGLRTLPQLTAAAPERLAEIYRSLDRG